MPLADIPHLDEGVDWQSWRTSVELRIRTMNGERFLTENPPQTTSPEKRKDWKRMDATVASFLYSHCSPTVKRQLANHTNSAKELWARLHDLFEHTGFEAKNAIISGLRHIKTADYNTIEEYLDAFEHQVNLCRTVAGWKVEEDIACLFLLDDLADLLEYWCSVKRSNWRGSSSNTSLASLVREAKDEARRQKLLKSENPALLPAITSSPIGSTAGDSLQSLQQYLRQDTTNDDDYPQDPMFANKDEFKKDIEDAVTSALQAAQLQDTQEQKPPTTVSIENHPTSPFHDIPEFDGKRSSYEAWKYMLKVKLSFDKRFGSEEEKAAYIMTRLRGQALDIFIYRDPEGIPKSSNHILMVLDKFFGTRDKVHAARSKIESMHQGDRPLDEFVTEFVTLAQRAEWDPKQTRMTLVDRLNYEQHGFQKMGFLTLNLPDLIDHLMEVVEYEAARDCFVGGINRASKGVGGRDAT